jgi:PmbA protein
LEIPPGDVSLEEMISSIDVGYYIDRCSWLRPDPRSGNFGAEIRTGYFIKNGEYQYAIKGGNLSGNVLQMIQNCEYISKERKYSNNVLYPYIKFKDLTISF